jgi:Bacteriophage Mu, Gp27
VKRSKIITDLPKHLRDQLNEKLATNGFRDYAGLSDWLFQMGYRISRQALQRYGSNFEKHVESIRLATEQAHEIALAAPDRENKMTDALTRLVQERVFQLLLDTEQISHKDLPRIARAIADLGRASISQKRWAEEITERLEAQKRAANNRIEELSKVGGLSPEAAEMIREILLGIDPLSSESATKQEAARIASEPAAQ